MATDGSPRREQDVRKKLNAMDYWNAAFRGLSPGGWQQNPPVATDMGDVPPFAEDVEDYIPADAPVPLQQNVPPVPVVLVDDLSHTRKRVEKFLITSTQQVNAVNSSIIVPRDPFRTQVVLNNLGPGIVYLGHNESVGTTGFALAVNSVLVLGTTRAIWAIQQSAQTSLAGVSIAMEYDKDTVED
jgi:hypothetical protein